MTGGNTGKAAFSALLKSIVVFILDFFINAAWSIFVLIIFSLFLANASGSYLGFNEMIDQMLKSPEYLFIASIYNIFAIIMVYFFWKYIDRQDTGVIGLKWRKNSVKLFGLGIAAGTAEIALIILLSISMGTMWFRGSGFEIFSNVEIQRSLFYGILAFILVGFGEEAVFRGYIQKRLMLSLGNKWALAISSFIFMAAHILTYGKLLDFIDVALGGVILGYIYILTDSLYFSSAYHFIYDYLQVNIVRLQDYEHYKGAVLYIFNNSGDVIVSGVNYGNVIEISFIIAELMVLMLLYVFRHRLRGISRGEKLWP